jgi:Ser/Thr protein kinase RdoA (MazF antagonist)
MTGDDMASMGEYLGCGRTASVYRWEDGQVLKLFRADIPQAVVVAERERMEQARALGFRVPKPGGIVRHDRRNGLLMERVPGDSMMDRIMAQPERLEEFAAELADLHSALNRCPAPAGMPLLGDLLRAKIGRSVRLSARERTAVLELLAGMPAGQALCHGDFHPGNLLQDGPETVIIDWPDAVCGSAMADVACTALLFAGHIALQADNPAAQAPMVRFHDVYLARRLAAADGDPGEVRRWRPILAAARLSEGIEEQLDWLHGEVRRALPCGGK